MRSIRLLALLTTISACDNLYQLEFFADAGPPQVPDGPSGGRGGRSVAATGGRGGTGGSGPVATGGSVSTMDAGVPSVPPTQDFDGFLLQLPCGQFDTGFDCLNVGCTQGFPKDVQRTFTLGGQPSTIYDLTFRVRGVVEAKVYEGGARRAGTTMDSSASGGDFWYEGGNAPAGADGVYRLDVSPPVPGAANVYFLNSASVSVTLPHTTWALNYTSTIKVRGGGTIRFRYLDANCRLTENCGPGQGNATTGCRAPRILDLSSVQPPPPATFSQPVMGSPVGAPGQWLFIDVLSIVPA